MPTKLILDVENDLIHEIESYAKEKNKSISQLVIEYFQELAQQKKEKTSLPITQSLIGVLQNSQINESDYKQHLEDKYL
jgi:hypothetical protein